MSQLKTRAAIKAGFIYFLGIFVLGFLLGTIRTLVLIPRIGNLAGVILEIPVMLTASWFFCSWIMARFRLTRETKYLFLFGGSAFLWLMIAEFCVSVYIFSQPWSEYLANFRTMPGSIGFLAQIIFSCIPLIQKNLLKR